MLKARVLQARVKKGCYQGIKVGKTALRSLYKDILLHQLNQPGQLPMGASIVFAPHQDDETLGCGGTIIQKRQAGVPVWIVFLTDGSKSHKHLMGTEEMKALRMQEACGAASILGVAEEQIRFLNIPNGELKQNHQTAQKQVEAILSEIQPQEVYIPSLWDFHYEHRETALIVMAAIAQLKADHLLSSALCIYEYPIWFWQQWPLVGLSNANSEERSRLLKRGLRYGFGLALVTQFRCAVSVREVLGTKRAALEQYVSQTTRLNQDPTWATLQDVANGEFIKFFFMDCEVFRQVKGLE